MQDYSQNNQIQGITGLGNPPKTETPIMLNSHQNQSFNPPVQSVNPPTDTKPIEQTSNLGDIKKNALQELRPLVDQLDLSPEEKFKTYIMIIQASDDSGLINKAYEVSKQIQDKKEKAQALLDVVNEINYFSQIENND
jgi:hypothetical protein